MRHLDLFSGIGGFALGLQRAGGFETVAFCEIEPYCQKVLAKHWPDVPIIPDIKDVPDATGLGRIDIVTGGFPCQPFSNAGLRKGAEDDRHLWPEMLAAIKAHRPTWVLGENVPGLIDMGLDTVLSDLEGEGYTCQTFVVPACAVDAKHRRDRIWIVAHTDSERSQGHGGKYELRKDSSKGEVGWGSILPNAKGKRQPGQGRTFHACNPEKDGNRKVNRTVHDRRWCPEPPVGRVANGIPRRVDRLRALGNAVVPAIIEQFGHAIREANECDALTTYS